MKRFLRMLVALVRPAVAVILLGYLVFAGAIKWSTLGGLLAAWPLTIVALLFLFGAIVFTALRLCVLLKPHCLHLSALRSIQLTLISTFFNACLPGATGGDLVRVYYASQGNAALRTEVITVILLDRAVGMFALLCWPLLIAPLLPGLSESIPALPAILGAGAAVVVSMLIALQVAFSKRLRNSRLVTWSFARLPLGKHLERIVDAVRVYQHDKKALLAAAGLSMLSHTCMIGVTLLVAMAIKPNEFAWSIAPLIPLGFMVNTLPLTPGGLGVGEAAFSQLFSMVGVGGGAEILLGWRILTILMSLSGLIFYLQRRGRFVYQSLTPPVEAEGVP